MPQCLANPVNSNSNTSIFSYQSSFLTAKGLLAVGSKETQPVHATLMSFNYIVVVAASTATLTVAVVVVYAIYC